MRPDLGNNKHETRSRARGPISVVVAEDAFLMREVIAETLESAPEVELVAVCSNAKELRNAIAVYEPEVVVTDIRMPPHREDDGIRVAVELRESAPETGVVVLSQYAEARYALDLLEHGTARRAYLLKERVGNRQELIGAIQAVAKGSSVIDPAVVDALIDARMRSADSPLTELTPRELEVLAEIATGKSNAAIAESLVLTKRAVEKHVNSIFARLNLPETEDVSRRVKAALIYLSHENATPR